MTDNRSLKKQVLKEVSAAGALLFPSNANISSTSSQNVENVEEVSDEMQDTDDSY